MGELCLLGHKIITNPLWDILVTRVAVYSIKAYKAGKNLIHKNSIPVKVRAHPLQPSGRNE